MLFLVSLGTCLGSQAQNPEAVPADTVLDETVLDETVVEETGAEKAAANPFYWVPKAELDEASLTPEQRHRLKKGCCGIYLPPVPPPSVIPTEESAALVEIAPGGSALGNPQEVWTLEGGVTLTQGDRRLTADKVVLDEPAQTLDATGHLEIIDNTSLLVGEAVNMNRETGAATVKDGQFIIFSNSMRGGAKEIFRGEDESLTLRDGEFTQCEPGDDAWLIRGSEIVLDQATQTGTAKHLRLEVSGVPVFYFPYASFPIGDASKSGLLYPSFSTEDYAQPIYFSLAPNYDLTLTPRYISQRGNSLETEFRHLHPLFSTVLGGAYLANGKDGVSKSEASAIADGNLTLAQATEFAGEDRWLFSLQQQGGDEQPWFSQLDITKVSDNDYFRQIDTANLSVNRSTHLRRLGELGYNSDNWLVAARWEEFQTLVPGTEEPYKQKPRLTGAAFYNWGKLSLGLENEITQFDYSNQDPSKIIGTRLRTDYQADWNQEWLWGYVKPSLLLKTLSYSLDEDRLAPGADSSPRFVVPQVAVDMGLFFERDGDWFGSDYLQTFEPQLMYFYSDYEDQSAIQNVDFDTSELTFSYSQLFRTSRFAGGDRIDDANQISLGLTSRFYGASGIERLSLSLGQIYYQRDRQVTLGTQPQLQSRSELAGQASGQLNKATRLGMDLLYDNQQNQLNQGNIYLRYFDEHSRIFNLGYRYTRQPPGGTLIDPIDRDISQTELSFAWPVVGNWNLIGRSFHDLTHKRELDTIVGLEYTSCCYRVRVMGRRWLDNELINQVPDELLEYKDGIFFEFHLRGLGLNLGNRLDSALADGVVNYQQREDAFLQAR